MRSRRLEVVGTRKNGRARRRHARGDFACLPRARPFSLFTHYFQEPATKAKRGLAIATVITFGLQFNDT